jgi:hypothetical protein
MQAPRESAKTIETYARNVESQFAFSPSVVVEKSQVRKRLLCSVLGIQSVQELRVDPRIAELEVSIVTGILSQRGYGRRYRQSKAKNILYAK